ncbi:MAG: betaine-aldehyde dehydrogenase [Halobacteriales archaeon SW_9_67_25]|nr:MAG: betaine-aldehyde dehydrogenase [Halobacteriales archaeon SW_9_67_25]
MGARKSIEQMHESHWEAHERVKAMSAFRAWIAGEATETGSTIETRDPAIDFAVTEVTACDDGAVDAAVAAGWEACEGTWGDTDPAERGQLLFEWADVLRRHTDDLALLETVDTGKPIAHARGEVEGAIDTLEYYASLARDQSGDQIQTGDDLHLYTRKEPYGVVGQIVPWNFPTWGAAWKFGPALAAGNACVLKPSAQSPLTAIRMAELSADVFPDGAINVVPGTGAETGAALTDHPRIRKLSFTGSTTVGSTVMHDAAETITPLTLELGGKSPFIVFPDADLEKAVDAVASGIFYATGEICDAFSRALVHEDVIEEFTDRFVEKAGSYVIGDPLDEETTLGPLTSGDQYEKVTEYIEIGKTEATLLTGGGRPPGDGLENGWYVEPTVFGDVTNDMRIAREEIFGPVQTIIEFATYEEAIEIANDTDYGLAAGIGTERTDLAHHAAADIDAGLVYVNEYGPISPEAPYGGFKESGIGKDLGRDALDHYRRTKSVYVNLDSPSL